MTVDPGRGFLVFKGHYPVQRPPPPAEWVTIVKEVVGGRPGEVLCKAVKIESLPFHPVWSHGTDACPAVADIPDGTVFDMQGAVTRFRYQLPETAAVFFANTHRERMRGLGEHMTIEDAMEHPYITSLGVPLDAGHSVLLACFLLRFEDSLFGGVSAEHRCPWASQVRSDGIALRFSSQETDILAAVFYSTPAAEFVRHLPVDVPNLLAIITQLGCMLSAERGKARRLAEENRGDGK